MVQNCWVCSTWFSKCICISMWYTIYIPQDLGYSFWGILGYNPVENKQWTWCGPNKRPSNNAENKALSFTGLLAYWKSISPESIETIGKHSVMYSWTSWTIGITKRRWNQVPRPSVKLHSPEGALAVGRCWRKTKLPLLEVGKLGIVWQNLRCTSPMLHGCSTCLVTWNPI